jgi:pectate lyase
MRFASPLNQLPRKLNEIPPVDLIVLFTHPPDYFVIRSSPSFMKAIFFRVLLYSLLNALLWQNAKATLFITESFDYSANGTLGSSATLGSTNWNGNNGVITVSDTAALLAPTGLAATAGRGCAVTNNSATSSIKYTGLTNWTGVASSAGNVLYSSFLLNVRARPSVDNNIVVGIHNAVKGDTQNSLSINLSAAGQLGIEKKAGVVTNVVGTPFSGPSTHLVVARYSFTGITGKDEVALWVDPSSDSFGSASEPTPGAATTNGVNAGVTLNYFNVVAQATSAFGNASYWIDEIRLGTTWADVTPSNGSTISATPVITQALLVPGAMILRGSNGPSSSVYQVLACTNLTLPSSNWPAISTNSFDAVGHFDSTNPVAPGLRQQFFRLLVGGTLPPSSTAPGITNQPQSLTVAVGASANFLVGAGGTAPLTYFWSFNTNTPVGGNSSTLSLPNVQPSDAGSYRVVVSNSVGTATSSVATLTVLIPPAITANPTNLTVVAGSSPSFQVTANGSAPLYYQWYLDDTNSPLTDETNATLTLVSVNAADAGNYFAVVTNAVGSATSTAAALTVLGPPVIGSQPVSQSVTVSNNVTFSVEVDGPAPLTYKWFFNTNTPVGGNSNSYALLNVQTNNVGTYSVIVTNNYGAVTSTFAMLTVNTSVVANAQFNLVGFGQAALGGGVIPETDPAYAKVTNALQLANAVLAFNKNGGIKVIEIMNDLDLGWNEIGSAVQTLGSTPFNTAATPKLHPKLITTGVSKMDIKYKNGGLTIFSANGATIRHCTFNIKSTHNIIIRNLKFDEMWEWDESSKGKYDGNDWDFIDLSNGGDAYDVWIDHCTFTKAYDGIVDMKAGTTNVTLSWCKYVGDDGTTNLNSMVWQQINSLESNKTSYAFYNFLRSNGYSTADIVQIIQGHDKTHLMGSNDKDPANVNLSATFHHQWFRNCWDRVVPRLRAGNVHDFNLYVDDTDALVAKRLRDTRAAAMSTANQNTLNTTYSFNPPLNGTISTEGGAILVEKSVYKDCLYPLRNNQTAPSDPTYTGKIMALDSIYHMDNADTTTTDFRGDSTNAPGSTYFGPAQATIIPFSWNPASGAPGGQLPYTYSSVLTDPAQLPAILSSSAGAGVINWSKVNWLKTTY